MLVLGPMSHDYTPARPQPNAPPQPRSHPDCPCSTLRLARAARLLTRQKGIATGGWGRKRHRLDARLCLGGQALSTRAGPHACNYCCQLALPPPTVAPAPALASVSLPFSPPRAHAPSLTCLPGAATSQSPAPPAPATSHQASEQARAGEPRRGWRPHPPCPARGRRPRGGRACLRGD